MLWSNPDFAPQNHGVVVLCPAKFWSNTDFPPQNNGDMLREAKKMVN